MVNKLEPTAEEIMYMNNIERNDLMKLSQIGMLQGIGVKRIYDSLCEGGIFRIETIKVQDDIFWVKLSGGGGYFTLYRNGVDTVSVNHIITVKNGKVLHCPVHDDKKYIIGDYIIDKNLQ